ncbi:MAG TPA: class I SAM-dependent methyltransferase [Acidimicrobiales bacterium]|jgi:2-polyprenyl-3-methyl-5-hydroxy-6-metoxy-1,4-benzoquinol methylase|nr:class I SAM-dependent methyltransferase [Acidimicrobiales bacterium]
MSTTTTEPTHQAADELATAIGAFAQRVAMATIGTFELATIELGMRLGLYASLAQGPKTPPELARAAKIDARYAREWLEQQATAGIASVDVEPTDGDPDRRVFSLPVAHQACLLDPDSLACVAPLATFATAGPAVLPELVEAYRNGTGISFAGYGEWVRRAQEGANRPQFTNLLAADWLPTMPDVVARLQGDGGRVAELGCGSGWASIATARAFPGATVDGFDSDAASIDAAKANAAAAGVGDRARFHVRDAATEEGSGYDLVCCFEALHDMAHPVEALAAMRQLAAPDGAVFVVDERAADALTPNDPDPMQHLFYAASVLHCLPVGRSEPDSAATGTVLRTATLERYATDAGYSTVEILPIEHDMFRFYRLHG